MPNRKILYEDTEGIIENGSNANGEWVKYGDGRMECRGRVSDTLSIDVARGNFYIRYGPTITFPQTFIEPPDVFSSYYSNSGTVDDREYFTTAATPNVSQCPTCIWSPVVRSSSFHVISYTAKGRWK